MRFEWSGQRQARIDALKSCLTAPVLPKIRKKRRSNFYHSKQWKALRDKAIRVLGNKCCRCGDHNGRGHVDHVMARMHHPHLALELTNLQVLCKRCNFWKQHNSMDFRTDEQRQALQAVDLAR